MMPHWVNIILRKALIPAIWKYDGMLAQHCAAPDRRKAPMVGASHAPLPSPFFLPLANKTRPQTIRMIPAKRVAVAGSPKQQMPIRNGQIMELWVKAQTTPFRPDVMAR